MKQECLAIASTSSDDKQGEATNLILPCDRIKAVSPLETAIIELLEKKPTARLYIVAFSKQGI